MISTVPEGIGSKPPAPQFAVATECREFGIVAESFRNQFEALEVVLVPVEPARLRRPDGS